MFQKEKQTTETGHETDMEEYENSILRAEAFLRKNEREEDAKLLDNIAYSILHDWEYDIIGYQEAKARGEVN